MSVVGIDLGCLSTTIGVARNKGIDIVANEASARQTPSLVGFGPKSRALGEAAQTQQVSNFKNTVGSLKRFVGKKFNDPDVEIEREFNTTTLVDIDGQVGAEVSYRGEKRKFTAVQLVAMYLGKIRDTASAELKLPVADVVLSCPPWFTDAQRRAMIDASSVAGLKTLRLINDNTAIALGYGITKTDLPEGDAKPRRVMFVDIGHSDYTASVVEFRKGELAVKSTACDRHFGGRNFDKAMFDHLAQEFKEKYKIDINTNQKAKLKIYTHIEKAKKVLSANTTANVQAESLMNDVDVNAQITREMLEDMVRPLLDRVTVPIEQALADAKLKIEDLDAIEMVGGCTRVPAIKDAISKFYGKALSFTCNQDEAVARGCTFACAILSPVFRVRDFSVHDIVNYPIEFTWEQSPDIPDEDTSLTVFNKGNVMPSTKILTFYRKQPFGLEARYAKPEVLPGKTEPWIGQFSVKGVKADAQDDFMICKLKARLNLHGILNLESGYYVEDVEVEEPIPEAKDGDKMDTDQPNGDAEPPKTRKVKKQQRKGELPLSAQTASLDEASLAKLVEAESEMYMEDKLVKDTEDKKNALESFIYEMRDHLEGRYAPFVSEDEKDKIREKLTATEDWLYEDGEDASKNQYIAKMEEIRGVAGPVIQRWNDKMQEEAEARRKVEEEAAAKKRAELEAKRKAEEEAKKAAEAEKKASETETPKTEDAEMKDADAVKPDGVEEAQ